MSLLSGGGPTGVSLAGLPPEMIMKLGEMGQQGDYQRMRISQLLGNSLENKQTREDAQVAAQQAHIENMRKLAQKDRELGQKDTELLQGDAKVAIEQGKLDNQKAMLYYDQEYKSALASNNYSAAGEAQARMKEMEVMQRALEAFEKGTATDAQKALVAGKYFRKGKGTGGTGTGEDGDDGVPEAQVTARQKAAAVAAQEAIKSSSDQKTFNVHNKMHLDWAPDDTRKMYRFEDVWGSDNVQEWELPPGITLGSIRKDAANLGITVEEATEYIYNKYVKK
jgi:hypothetical protein